MDKLRTVMSRRPSLTMGLVKYQSREKLFIDEDSASELRELVGLDSNYDAKNGNLNTMN